MHTKNLRLAKILTTSKEADRLAAKGFIIEHKENKDTGKMYFFAYATEDMYKLYEHYELPDPKYVAKLHNENIEKEGDEMTGILKKLFGGKAKEVEVELTVSHEPGIGQVPVALSIKVGDEIIPTRLIVKDKITELPEQRCEQVSEGRERTTKPVQETKIDPLVEHNKQTAWHVH